MTDSFTRAANDDCIDGGLCTRTKYLYDGANPVSAAGNLLLSSGNLDEIYALVSSSGATSFLRDGINSTVALTTSTGAISSYFYYSPYGDSANTGVGTTAFQFTGRENDGATALYYYRARYYSPTMGRFISEDPVGLLGGVNYYAYTQSRPTMLTDPTGHGPLEAAVGAGIGGLWGYVSGKIAGEEGAALWQHVAEDAAIGGLTGLTDGLNWLQYPANAALNIGGEYFKEKVDSWETGCPSISPAKIAMAGVTGVLGDLGGKLIAMNRAINLTDMTHVVQGESSLLSAFWGSNISGAVDAALGVIEGR